MQSDSSGALNTARFHKETKEKKEMHEGEIRPVKNAYETSYPATIENQIERKTHL